MPTDHLKETLVKPTAKAPNLRMRIDHTEEASARLS
jgi:hypothetical protein